MKFGYNLGARHCLEKSGNQDNLDFLAEKSWNLRKIVENRKIYLNKSERIYKYILVIMFR